MIICAASEFNSRCALCRRLIEFIKPCRQIEILYERGASGACQDIPNLPTTIEQINTACCEQNGVNVCVEQGGPDKCDGLCAEVFLPFFKQCMTGRSSGKVSVAEMSIFVQMNEACLLELPDAELQLMLTSVWTAQEEPNCFIDTSVIRTKASAKQASAVVCYTDSVPICGPIIASGASTCKVSGFEP